MKRKPSNPVIKKSDADKLQAQGPQRIEVTVENAPKLTVHFLQHIYGRLGYMIKLLEEIKEKR